MSATLTRMRWWHIDDVLALEQELFADDRWTARTYWSELGQLDTRHYLVAREGEDVVGYAGLCDYPDEAFVQTIAVAATSQGKGLGALLLQALLDEAERRGQHRVLLEVRADNDSAIALYERFGFRRTGVRRGYYQPSGADAVVMTRP
ncbi:MAG: [ribosomal protein S18]-alanine N-acetyltransferase [Actinomycetota bacterium]|jgi:ribosomal-protein-alanine N-acetyltransferase|nr:[ribosomal protein S18]-alanine N-acetyltransferase [Actinomycetota bacterium]